MANDLTFNFAGGLTLPDYLTAFGDEAPNIKDRASVPTLSGRGRKWTVILNGEGTVMERVNADGDKEPVGVIRVFIVDAAPSRGRTYYEGKYDPEKPGRPNCWSSDGVTPDSSVEAPPASRCDGCPMAVRGSMINDLGKQTTACQSHRLIAVVPAGKLDHPPLRTKLSITSIYDGQSPDLEAQRWFAFDQYLAFLRSKGIKRTGQVITKMKFDPNVDYPKIIFSPDRVATAEEVEAQRAIIASGSVTELVNETWTPNGADGTLKAQEPAPAQTATRTVRPAQAAEQESFITPEMEAEAAAASAKARAEKAAATRAANKAKADAEAAAAAKAAAAKAAAAKAAAAKAAAEDDDGGFGDAPAASKAVDASDVPDDVASLLSEWG